MIDQIKIPNVWLLVLGYNNSDDSIECLQSLKECLGDGRHLLYVDNGSREEEADRVRRAHPDIVALRHPENIGVARGFNSGLSYALEQGADFVAMINNDTKVAPDSVDRMLEVAEQYPDAGIIIPKVYFYDHPKSIWSAGSKCRRLPPAIVQNKTRGDDDGRFDQLVDLEYTPFCVAMFRRKLLEDIGLLDMNFHFFYEDHDFCLRTRDAGYRIVFAPKSHLWHKISKTIRGGNNKLEYWSVYGRSHGIFCRKHRRHREVTGAWLNVYVGLRTLYEGGWKAVKAFREGFRAGQREDLTPIPAWNDPAVDRPEPMG